MINYMTKYVVGFTMDKFHIVYSMMRKTGKIEILKGKEMEYRRICSNIDNEYSDELKEYLSKAVEVDKKI